MTFLPPQAKAALDTLTSDYTVMEIDGDSNMAAIQDYMKDLTGGRSVPRVFMWVLPAHSAACANSAPRLPFLFAVAALSWAAVTRPRQLWPTELSRRS